MNRELLLGCDVTGQCITMDGCDDGSCSAALACGCDDIFSGGADGGRLGPGNWDQQEGVEVGLHEGEGCDSIE